MRWRGDSDNRQFRDFTKRREIVVTREECGFLTRYVFFKIGYIVECLHAKGNDSVKRERLTEEKEELIVETKSFSR